MTENKTTPTAPPVEDYIPSFEIDGQQRWGCDVSAG